MNQRERFILALQFEGADRLPYMDSGYACLDAWHEQGLPATVDTEEQVEKYFGLDRGLALCLLTDHGSMGVSLSAGRHSPQLAALMGETTRAFSLFTPPLGENAIPLKTPADLEAVAAKRRGNDQRRLIADWSHRLEGLQREEAAIGIYLWGFFTCQLELLGSDPLARTYLSNPAMIHRINLHHLQFCRELLEMVTARTPIDFAVIGETLTGPPRILFTPSIYKEFMKRYYTELISAIRGKNIGTIALCGTGLATGLPAPFQQAGINTFLPCAVAAGDEPLALREKNPRLALYGGIDHRAIVAGRDAINTELRRIRPLVKAGGYIPALDNALPPETPLANYEYYLAQKWEMFFDDQNPRRF